MGKGRGLALVVAMRSSLGAGQPPALELITLLLFLTSVLSQKVSHLTVITDYVNKTQGRDTSLLAVYLRGC